MISFLKNLIKPKYKTLNKIEIKADNILYNFNYLKSLQPTAEIFPVLKSNAYGHGLKELCQILNKSEAIMVAVDSFPEAQIVYHYFKGKVLILNEMPFRAYRYCNLKRTEFMVYNQRTLRYLARFGKKIKIHLFVNTGMNREGIKNLPEFIRDNKKYLDQVEITGLCSHLASATQVSELNDQQEENFNLALNIMRASGFFPRWIHLGNSAALKLLDNKNLTAFRCGLALYGHSPWLNDKDINLKPALNVYSQVSAIQNLLAGEAVSYNEEYRASQNTKIATIPFGYFEGLPRSLSNQAKLLVENKKETFPAVIAGAVCMNITCLDVDHYELKLGDRVQVISDDNDDPNSVENLARQANLITYEFLVKLQGNIRREIIW